MNKSYYYILNKAQPKTLFFDASRRVYFVFYIKFFTRCVRNYEINECVRISDK